MLNSVECHISWQLLFDDWQRVGLKGQSGHFLLDRLWQIRQYLCGSGKGFDPWQIVKLPCDWDVLLHVFLMITNAP
jgi:hypothetical protein